MKKEDIENPASLPDTINKQTVSSVRFRISGDIIERFGELTGDRSALHTEGDFARRSMYRREVAHGMLPVGFVAAMGILNIEGFTCYLAEINARFMAPVYVNSRLGLMAEVVEIDSGAARVKLNFTIENQATKSIITKGSLAVGYRRESALTDIYPADAKCASGMLCERLSPKGLRLEEIACNDADSLRFSIKQGSIAAFLGILADGAEDEDTPARVMAGRFHLPNLLSTMLISTSVGMCIPGRYATFLEFSANFHETVETDMTYVMKGLVSHVSKSTRIIKKSVSVHHEGAQEAPLMTGKAGILVNPPSSSMPSMKAIRERSLDPGLKGKVVLITGASRGIGETTAKMFALHGSRVVVNYLKGENDARDIVKEIESEGGEAVALKADVSDPDQVHDMVVKAVERFGAIDILVNNAVRDFRPISFLNLIWDDIQKDIDVTARGAFNCCKEVIPPMIERGGGKIINVSTIAVENPPANQAKYVISKSALVGLTRSLSVEFAAKNIQVNMVVPNFVETDLVSHIPDAYRKKMAQDAPMRKNASPTDVAQAIIFLASSYSSFTTGQKIMVTGGAPPYL